MFRTNYSRITQDTKNVMFEEVDGFIGLKILIKKQSIVQKILIYSAEKSFMEIMIALKLSWLLVVLNAL